jgi:phosphate-selective porin OprO/OprP
MFGDKIMKMTTNFLLTALVLSAGAGNALAQPYTPSATYATSSGYFAADAADLESRISKLEADMKKKEDKVDTKKKFSADISGRIFMDTVHFGDPYVKSESTTAPYNGNPLPDFVGLRDARIGVSGKGFEIFDYKVELAFERELRLTDVYMGVQKVPGLDYVRIGHYKVETGLSYLTSGRNSVAMERASAVSTFNNSRRLGIGQTYLFAHDQVRWFNGVFLADDINTATNKYLVDEDLCDKGAIYNSRFTMVPFYDKDGERYFHLGGHYMYKGKPKDTWTRGEMDSPGTTYVGGFNRAGHRWFYNRATDAWHYNQGGLETAYGYGPFSVASELFAGSFGDGRDMYGGYVEVKYFLTGDHRPYSKSSGTLGNVKMKKNFLTAEECFQTHHHGAVKGYGVKSWGAWEVYAQWSFVDSDRVARSDTAARGGRAVDTVLGLNWYWNPNTRMMFEYVHSEGTQRTFDTTDGVAPTPYGRATEDIFATSFRFYF